MHPQDPAKYINQSYAHWDRKSEEKFEKGVGMKVGKEENRRIMNLFGKRSNSFRKKTGKIRIVAF
jgi:hypothetical protein